MTRRLMVLLLALAAAHAQPALAATTIDFEGLADGTALTSQIPGVTFANTVVLGSGISLNEFEFPPRSGSHVASDDGGPMQISFAAPVASVSAYFTYALPLTLVAFDAGGQVVGTAFSRFSSNLALSGDAGTSPNELVSLAVPLGFSRLTITGDGAGGSFVMDDFSASAVPEPASAWLLLCGLLVVAGTAQVSGRRGGRS